MCCEVVPLYLFTSESLDHGGAVTVEVFEILPVGGFPDYDGLLDSSKLAMKAWLRVHREEIVSIPRNMKFFISGF